MFPSVAFPYFSLWVNDFAQFDIKMDPAQVFILRIVFEQLEWKIYMCVCSTVSEQFGLERLALLV